MNEFDTVSERVSKNRLRGIALIALTVGYVCALVSGVNGVLFTAFTNAVLIILFLTPKQVAKWLKRNSQQNSE